MHTIRTFLKSLQKDVVFVVGSGRTPVKSFLTIFKRRLQKQNENKTFECYNTEKFVFFKVRFFLNFIPFKYNSFDWRFTVRNKCSNIEMIVYGLVFIHK